MTSRADALYAGGHSRDSGGPIVVVHVDGDQLLSRVRDARSALLRSLEMTKRVFRMWYL